MSTPSNCDYDLPSDFVDKNRQCLFDRIAELAEKRAESYDSSNQISGKILFAVLRGWRHGLKSTVPPDFKQFVNQVSRESDPEYQEYLRLKEKFEK